MRLDKFLSHTGFGSRKEVKKIVKSKAVKINEVLITDPAHTFDPQKDHVTVYDQAISYEEDVYIMINKPAGYICSKDVGLYPSVLELIDTYRDDLIMVGRLDVDTEGLFLITNDGQFSHRIAHGKKDVMKQYYVELEKDFDQSYIEALTQGIMLDEAQLKPAQVTLLSEKSLLLSIAEGKYHQVKRMMQYCDNEVSYLKRMQIGDLKLDESLALGEYRDLSEEEKALF